MISFIEFSMLCFILLQIPEISGYVLGKIRKPQYRLHTDLSQNIQDDTDKITQLIPHEIHPSRIVNSLLQYSPSFGKEWSYSEFLNNIDDDKVSGVSILENGKNAIAIDNNIVDVVEPSNLHNVQLFSDNFHDVLDKLTTQNINVDVYNIPDNQLLTIGSFLLNNGLSL